MLTASEKVRLHLTGHPHDEPYFQHEGPAVVHWITGGTAPSVYVTFEHQGKDVVACCPHCGQELGRFRADYGAGTDKQLGAIREAGHQHHCQETTTRS